MCPSDQFRNCKNFNLNPWSRTIFSSESCHKAALLFFFILTPSASILQTAAAVSKNVPVTDAKSAVKIVRRVRIWHPSLGHSKTTEAARAAAAETSTHNDEGEVEESATSAILATLVVQIVRVRIGHWDTPSPKTDPTWLQLAMVIQSPLQSRGNFLGFVDWYLLLRQVKRTDAFSQLFQLLDCYIKSEI